MTYPTTKAALLDHMHKSHQTLLALLSRIPDERTDEIALYDTWSIKDFIAHIAWWQQNASERLAILLRGETPPLMLDYDHINATILEDHREMTLDQVRGLEVISFAALERVVRSASEADIFYADRFPAARGNALIGGIADNSYEHYAEHIDDIRAWMRQNGLD